MATDGQQSGEPSSPFSAASSTTRVVVATTVALAFISFWRAASVVLSDLASTMFYVGGIVETSVGPSAPWFVFGILFFGFALRSVYMESCSMFVRGGAYVVVRDSMGPVMAKISVSALVVDYVLTGPISSVSAGQYLAGLLNELIEKLGRHDLHIDPNGFAMFFGLAVTLYFWRSNIRGVTESSGHALHIMQITTVMVVVLMGWCIVTLLGKDNVALPPAPSPSNLRLTEEGFGWLHDTWISRLPAIMLIVAFGHSLLAMSGFETLAHVYREIGYPKLKNLKLTANIICIYAFIATGFLTLFTFMLIPNGERLQYRDNLLGGLTAYLAGPPLLTFILHVFVVVVGTLILSGAVNSSIIGANGVFSRVAEDGILLEWFRRPHPKFGTAYNIINLIVVLQMATIVYSKGDVILLGEAYAFGVTWSFFLKALGVMALRFQRHDQEYKFPGNLTIAGRELPIGLAFTVVALFLVAIANLLTKKLATKYGLTFAVLLFVIFTISERVNMLRRKREGKGLEQFNLEHEPQVDSHAIDARPGCVLVSVRGYQQMEHLQKVLEKTNLRRHDIVVMTVRPISGTGEYELAQEQLFTSYEQELFSHVVSMAEKQGKHVDLLVVPGLDPFDAMVQTATKLKASRLVTGVSLKMASEELARRIGLAWEKLPEPKHAFSLEVIRPGRPSMFVNLGPHPPRLWPEDVDRVHDIWLQLSEREGFGSQLHHRDVVGVALRRLEQDLTGMDREAVLDAVRQEMRKG